MEVRPGYKRSEVGVIPEDWGQRAFGRLYAAPSRNGIYKTPEFQGRGTRIVNMGEMFGFEFISDQDMSRVALTTRELAVSRLQDGDLLFGRRSVVPAGAGKCSLVVSPSEPITFESSIIRVRLEKTGTHPRFYYYFFASPTGRSAVGTIVSGTTVKGIRATELRDLKVPVPTKAEQVAIAAALSDADAFIESMEQLLAKKRHVKQGAMQELLTGKKRLPGFNRDWERMPLSATAAFLKGSGLSRAKISATGTRRCILYGELFTTYGRVITGVVSRTDSNDGLLSVSGDVLMPGSTTTTGIDLAIASALLVNNVALGGDINVVRRKSDNYDATFLANYLTYARRNAIAQVTQGITIHHLYGRDLERVAVQLPSLPEQTAIAAILSDMDAEIAALEAKLAKTRQLKLGMMQELLTGRTRLV